MFNTPERPSRSSSTYEQQTSLTAVSPRSTRSSNDPYVTLMTPTSSAPSTPSRRGNAAAALPTSEIQTESVDTGYSDRFIPSRASSSLSFSLLDSESRGPSLVTDSGSLDAGHSTGSSDAAAAAAGNAHRRSNSHDGNGSQLILNMLLRSELIDENTYVARANLATTGTPTRENANLLRFQHTRQSYQDQVLNDLTGGNVITSVVKPFNISPMGSASSHFLLASPQKHNRKIPKVPFKVLDAPALQDDFYLNLVDW